MLTDNISEVDIARTAIDTNATAQKHVGVAGHVSADRWFVHHGYVHLC